MIGEKAASTAKGEANVELELDERICLVTGAASGIGAAVSRALAQAGGTVVATDVDEAGAKRVAASLPGGNRAESAQLDVRDEASWQEVVQRTLSEYGALHVLVNNAGIDRMQDLEQETVEGFDSVVAVNQRGVWLGMKHACPAIAASGGGSVVNLSSFVGAVGTVRKFAYQSTKAAIRVMTKSAALKYAEAGVRVNSVHPGIVDTPMNAELLRSAMGLRYVKERIPLGRLGTSEEVAAVVVFLASEASSYMTGSEIYVDGGWTAQ